MKDKLYKLNKKSHRNIYIKLGYSFLILFSFLIMVAIPLSISLTNQANNRNNIALRNEIPFSASDALSLNK